MNWTVEVIQPSTGEEMTVAIDADSAEQAATRARARGYLVRDCYRTRAGREFFKVVRVLAWVWVGCFVVAAVVLLTCGLGGWLATPGSSGLRDTFGGLACLTVAALLGALVASAMTDTLRRKPTRDPRCGFDVVPRDPPSPAPPSHPVPHEPQ